STHMSAVDRATLATRAAAIGAVAFGALALGATAIGALAIGRLAVGALAVKRGRVHSKGRPSALERFRGSGSDENDRKTPDELCDRLETNRDCFGEEASALISSNLLTALFGWSLMCKDGEMTRGSQTVRSPNRGSSGLRHHLPGGGTLSFARFR